MVFPRRFDASLTISFALQFLSKQNKMSSSLSDPRMGKELKIIGGVYIKKAKRCWRNKEETDTDEKCAVLLWLGGKRFKATKIFKSSVMVLSECKTPVTYVEAMFQQHPILLKQAKWMMKRFVNHGVFTQADLTEVNLHFWHLAVAEIERMSDNGENPKYKVKYDRNADAEMDSASDI